MKQWCFDNFTQFLNLLFASTNITVRHIWFVFHLHHRYRWIDFWWQRYMNLVFIPVNTVMAKCILLNQCSNLQEKQNKKTCFTYPTRIPSSISVGATESAKSTTNFANCFTLIMYFGSSESALIIFVQRATYIEKEEKSIGDNVFFSAHTHTICQLYTCNGCSFVSVCLSAAKSHSAGAAKPVSLSFMPVNSLTCLIAFWMSSSIVLILLWYWPWPWKWKWNLERRIAISSSTCQSLHLRLPIQSTYISFE